MERLAGATALAHGKVQEGRRLIFSAYMSARKHGMKGEVARCLRLIADTQTGQDRLSSLNAAVEGLAVAGVPFEHAEALLCLAQAEVQESISLSGFAYTSIDVVASLEKLSYSLEVPQQNARLMKAKSHLRTAAGLLMTELSSSKYRSCSKSVMSQYNSPTGRRKSSSGSKKSKKPDLLEEERSTLSGLLGSVHELTGKVGILMQQLDDANVALHAAASNEDWRKGSREEAAQVETFLEHYNGAGVQHIALMCTDIVKAVKEMKARSEMGGFAFLPRPSVKYYRELSSRVGSLITEEEMEEYEELGILVDVDAGGVLLQIFTAPIGDRPTVFIEILQRVGVKKGLQAVPMQQFPRGGCGGFGTGNLLELFRSLDMAQTPSKVYL
ncbi:unnamed protein product [Closterium sp. NIES-64]|nr:unnamed protein product [Closterium sp. NIES-64]